MPPREHAGSNLRGDNHRDANHKLRVLGLMPDDAHGSQHGRRPAEGAHHQQCPFADAPGPAAGGAFIVHSQYYGQTADGGKPESYEQ